MDIFYKNVKICYLDENVGINIFCNLMKVMEKRVDYLGSLWIIVGNIYVWFCCI